MIAMTSFPPGDPQPIHGADPAEPRKTRRGQAAIVALLFLVLSGSGSAQQALDKDKLDRFLDRLAEKNKAMGSLTIAKDGKVLYTRAIGYGQINGAEKKPLTAASRFGIASITKTYTAVMILQLVEEGKLKLTDTLDQFIPQVPNARKITIGQILAHRRRSVRHQPFEERIDTGEREIARELARDVAREREDAVAKDDILWVERVVFEEIADDRLATEVAKELGYKLP